MDVMSFEKNHICGAWNLLNLCLSSPHRTPAGFDFFSSVSAMMVKHTTNGTIRRLDAVLPMGHGQSKLVTEQICRNAAARTPISARILLAGQTADDTVNWIWNATEALPLTVR